MISAVSHRLHAKSAALLLSIEGSLARIMTGWFVTAMLASVLRIAVSPRHAAPEAATLLPYLLLVTAPLISMGLALHWFRDGERLPQPVTRLAASAAGGGRPAKQHAPSALWHQRHHGLVAGRHAAQRAGPRAGISGRNPSIQRIRARMAVDAASDDDTRRRYPVAASIRSLSSRRLRRVPLFPRLLVAIWAIDIAMQLGIACAVAGTEGLPPGVAERASQAAGRQYQEGPDQHRAVAALSADVASA